MFVVATVNVNGIRAVARRDGLRWLRESAADILCLQEVRADDETLTKILADHGMGDWDCVHSPSAEAGRSGVAVLSRAELLRPVTSLPKAEFADSGRWVEASVLTADGPVTAVSTYVHTGEAQTGRQRQKYRFLSAADRRMAELADSPTGAQAVVCGDFNVARDERDIKNWRGNVGKAGFLPKEQEYLDRWAAAGWSDVGRDFAGDTSGPYTWWSWRGKAFDNDSGWRIDYVWSTRDLAQAVTNVTVHRADSYAARWSDHAPVVATFAECSDE